MAEKRYYATGKRKTAIARVWMKEGSGNWVVNKRDLVDYFREESTRRIIQQPLDLVGKKEAFDFYAEEEICGVKIKSLSQLTKNDGFICELMPYMS